jgi:hypothetical protein
LIPEKKSAEFPKSRDWNIGGRGNKSGLGPCAFISIPSTFLIILPSGFGILVERDRRFCIRREGGEVGEFVWSEFWLER